MIFTKEQIDEIEQKLAKRGAKDTQLPLAKTPLTGDESIAIVQERENRLVPVGSIVNTDEGIFNVSEYLKVKTEVETSVILTLSEAIEACPSRAKKAGQIVTFLDKTKVWQQYQYQSDNIADWNNLLKWKNLNDINSKPIDDESTVIYNISDYIPGGSKYGQQIGSGIYTIYGTTTPVSQYRVIGGYDSSLGEVSFPLELDETIVIKEIEESVSVYDTYYLFVGNSIDGYSYQNTLCSDEDVIPAYIPTAFGDDGAYVLVNINRLENKINGKLDNKVDKVQGKGLSTNDFTNENVSELANSIVNATYNSNTKKLVFTKNNNGTVEIDATPFIKDGMVNSVSIDNGYLVITFNTDSGKETIRIALTDIFNPDNYYTKTQTNSLLGDKVDKEQGKGLSTNDYTTEEKSKLGALPTNSELTTLLNGKANTSDLANVATSGSYNDLRDKPTIQELATVKHLYALDSTNSDYPSMIGPDYVYLNKTCTFGTISIVKHTPEGVEDGFTQIHAQTYSEAEATIDNTTYTSYSYNNNYYLGIKSPFFVANVAQYGHDNTLGVIKFVATQEGLFKVHAIGLALSKCVIKVNGVDTTSLDQNIVAVQVNVGDVVKIIPTSTSQKFVRIIGFVLEGNCGVSVFVNDAGYLTQHQDISGKTDKVSNATNGNFAALDSNGNLIDSGHKHSDYLTQHQDLTNYVQKSNTQGLLKNDGTVDTTQYLTQHQDISGKADKSEMSVVPGTGADADKTTITLKQGTSATVLTAHQDVSDKEDIIPIEAVASGATAINAAVNTYYEVAGEVGALAITLPTPTDLTKVSMVVVHLTAGTTPNVVIGSTETIDYSAAYDISASKEYEINCLFNGDKWVVADMEVV